VSAAPDDLVSEVVADIVDYFNFSDHTVALGDRPRIIDYDDTLPGVIRVLHETEPWGVEITVTPTTADDLE
jgi:hypothetical protein